MKAQTLDRPATVKRLKKACELAQGFCLTFLVIVLFGVLFATVVRMSGAVNAGNGRETLAERLYVGEVGGISNPFVLPGEWEVFSTSNAGYRADTPEEGDLAVIETAPLPYVVQALSVGGLEVAVLFLGARFFGRIAKTGKPFCRERARELGLIGKLVIVMSFAPCLLMIVTMAIGHLVLRDWPASYDIALFSYGALACGLLILAFAKVFEYGCILQEQDDELV